MSEFDFVQVRRLDMTLLLVFSELVRQRKLRAVGERLGLTSSAVSHALKRLRDLFGHDLFVRRPHGVEPTARALEIEPMVREILALAHAALRKEEDFDPARVRRTLRIGMPDYEAALIAPPLLARMRAGAPGLRLAIRFCGRKEALSALMAGEIDLAIGGFPRSNTEMIREDLLRDELIVVARAGHPRIAARLTLERYLAEDHVVVSPSGTMRGMIDKGLAAIQASRRIVLALPSFVAALAIVAETDYLCAAPRRLAAHFAQQLSLQVLAAPIGLRPFTISALRHRRDAQDRLVAWTIEQLRQS